MMYEIEVSDTTQLRSMVCQVMIKTKRRDKRVLQQLLIKTYRFHYNHQLATDLCDAWKIETQRNKESYLLYSYRYILFQNIY